MSSGETETETGTGTETEAELVVDAKDGVCFVSTLNSSMSIGNTSSCFVSLFVSFSLANLCRSMVM